jgi:hypothetical protein
METVYDLRNDSTAVTYMQRGSLSTERIGLQITHGLVGSTEWWNNIESGVLPLQTIKGVVSGFWPGQGHAGPAEFQLQDSNGIASNWLCEMDPRLAATRFVLGQSVEVDFVVQDLKTPFNGDTKTKVPVAIRLGGLTTRLRADAP